MPLKWYGTLALICILGVALVVYSRYELQHPAPAIQPTVGTHWFAAFGVDLCGRQQPDLAANPNASKAPIPGLRTDGDGVIQVAPTAAKDAGDNATLARFVQTYPKLTLTSDSLGLPGKQMYKNGQKCPTGSPDAGKAGTVQIKVWPSFTPPGSNHPTIQTDPSSVRLADGQLITLAFVPSGKSIPKPPGAAITAMLNDRVNAGEATTTVPTPAIPTTTAPATSTTTPSAATTAPPTTAPKTTTTVPKTTTTAPKTTTTKPASSSTTTGR